MLQTLALIGRRWLSMVDWQKTESRPLLSSPQNTIFWLNFQQPISFGHIDCKWCQVCRCMLPQNSHLCTLAVFSIMRAQDIIIGHFPFCYCKRTRITNFGPMEKHASFLFSSTHDCNCALPQLVYMKIRVKGSDWLEVSRSWQVRLNIGVVGGSGRHEQVGASNNNRRLFLNIQTRAALIPHCSPSRDPTFLSVKSFTVDCICSRERRKMINPENQKCSCRVTTTTAR